MQQRPHLVMSAGLDEDRMQTCMSRVPDSSSSAMFLAKTLECPGMLLHRLRANIHPHSLQCPTNIGQALSHPSKHHHCPERATQVPTGGALSPVRISRAGG